MAVLKRIVDGDLHAKLSPIESLQYAMIQQAVQDIKQTRWSDNTATREFRCSYREGYEAYMYLANVLRYNGYSTENICSILREITTQDYKKPTCERAIKDIMKEG